jgi:hypothetical protein
MTEEVVETRSEAPPRQPREILLGIPFRATEGGRDKDSARR